MKEQLTRVTTPPAVPLLITDGIEVTDDGVWSWVQIPDASTFLLDDDELADATTSTARALAGLLPPGQPFHLKTVFASHMGESYRESWRSVGTVRAPGTDHYIGLGAHRIDLAAGQGLLRRRVNLLGVCWPEDTEPPSGWERFAGGRARTSSKARRMEAQTRLEVVRPAVDRWLAAARRSALAAQPAAAGLIGWAYARELRSTGLPVPIALALTASGLAGLAHGRIDPTLSSDYLLVTDLATGATRYSTILVAAATTGFPAQDLSLPGGEWLGILAGLHGVEGSVRGVNHGQVASRVLLENALKVVRSQIRESAITEGPPPPAAAEAEQVLEQRIAEVQHRADVMVTTHARWVIQAGSPSELTDRVAEVRQRYDGIIDLQRVGDVQDLLWMELLPGDRVRVPEFGADQPMRTLAGSWFHGGSPFGDPVGPYMGLNAGPSADPVQLHVASRTESNRTMPTTIVFSGRAGTGKSTSMELFLLGLLAEHAWVLLPDVKGDLGGITDVAAEVLGVTVQTVNAVDADCAGMMDPMRFAPTLDEARTLTLDVLMCALSAEDRRNGEAVLEAAIDSVLQTTRESWSIPAVLRTLQRAATSEPNPAEAKRLGRILHVRSATPQLRAVCGDLAENHQPLLTDRGLIYLRLDGLDFPHHTPDPDQWSVPQRCSMATLRVSLAFALAQSRRVRELTKVVALPELHLLARYPEGLAFVEWLVRVGRALKTYVLLDSQSAVEFARIPSLVEQIAMAFCFRATSRNEQDAQGVLLGRPEPGEQLRAAMRTLGVGECVAMDRKRRLTVLTFDRLTVDIADQLSTNAGDDSLDPPATTDDLTPDAENVERPAGVDDELVGA